MLSGTKGNYMKRKLTEELAEELRCALPGYEKVYGYDYYNQKAYVKMNNTEEMTVSYDFASKKLTIIDGRFLSLRENKLYVLTSEGFLDVIHGQERTKLRELGNHEKVIDKKYGFLIIPSHESNDKFFSPYVVTFDGKVVAADNKEAADILWERLRYLGSDDPLILTRIYQKRFTKTKFPMETMSIKNLKCICENTVKRGKDSLFYDILLFLEKFIDKEKDITELLYVLYNINQCIDKEDGVFPSIKLCKLLCTGGMDDE